MDPRWGHKIDCVYTIYKWWGQTNPNWYKDRGLEYQLGFCRLSKITRQILGMRIENIICLMLNKNIPSYGYWDGNG